MVTQEEKSELFTVFLKLANSTNINNFQKNKIFVNCLTQAYWIFPSLAGHSFISSCGHALDSLLRGD